MDTTNVLIGGGGDYELLDSGGGEKLERFGSIVTARPEPEALWEKRLPKEVWERADAVFVHNGKTGAWKGVKDFSKNWQVSYGGFIFSLKLSTFKHVGLFPEQVSNWCWLEEKIKNAGRPISVLNLFGYTGGATLAAASLGAEVCHVDGSRPSVTLAKENARLSGLGEKPTRWIVDDARIFVEREIKRGNFYDCVVMDPPSFGHGPGGELWKIEEDFPKLLKLCEQVLSKNPLAVLINGYAAGYSAVGYGNTLLPYKEKFGGEIEVGELALKESDQGNKTGRLLPAGIFARWSK